MGEISDTAIWVAGGIFLCLCLRRILTYEARTARKEICTVQLEFGGGQKITVLPTRGGRVYVSRVVEAINQAIVARG